MNSLMDHPFPKSTTFKEKSKRLLEVVCPEDALAILINADPDSIASALALKRIFWRKVRKADIYHVNTIERADNLAFIRLLKIEMRHIRYLKPSLFTKWAIVDSQPHHHEKFGRFQFDIIIDHHPVAPSSKASFVDIGEDYGANATIMTELLRAAGIKPAPRLATALVYGIKTDTDNFTRGSLPNDINAFRYLYPISNKNIIKKIESSEMTKDTLASFRVAMERLILGKKTAFVHMGEVKNPDILVIIADFFMKFAEATWSIVSGLCDKKLIIILRNAGFRGDAGKAAQSLFGDLGGSAGGHKESARAEIPLEDLPEKAGPASDLGQFIQKRLRNLK